MRRGTFLKRMGLAVGGLAVAGKLPAEMLADGAVAAPAAPEALAAAPVLLGSSGGLCAPVTPYYTLQNVAVAVRPVRDSLPAFPASRSGITYPRNPVIPIGRPASVSYATDSDDDYDPEGLWDMYG